MNTLLWIIICLEVFFPAIAARISIKDQWETLDFNTNSKFKSKGFHSPTYLILPDAPIGIFCLFIVYSTYNTWMCRPVPDTLTYNGPDSVAMFMVSNPQLCTDAVENAPYVVIQLSLNRDIVGSLLNDFLPVLLCVVIGHTTNYYNNFEVAVATNLTLLLVLVTLWVFLYRKSQFTLH